MESFEVYLKRLSQIVGMDCEVGLSRSGGDTDAYHKSVSIFARKGSETFCNLHSLFGEGKYTELGVTVHGLRGTLANIGVMGLAEEARKLEQAAKDGDAAYCCNNFPSFIEKVARIHQEMTEVVIVPVESTNKPIGAPAFLSDALQTIQQALDDFDDSTATEYLLQLQAFSYGEATDALILQLGHRIDEFDYDSALDIAKDIASSL